MRHGIKAAAAAMIFVLPALAVDVAFAKEQQIGAAVYEQRPQRDIIEVGAREGAFRSIRFEVRGSAVEVLDLKVVYGNGTAEDIRVRQNFKVGSSSRVIDLQGQRRAIRQIIVTYVAKGPARIVFFGVEASGGGAAANWERLGCKDVRFLVDRDIVRVGRKDGRFSSIRLKVRNAPVEMFDLRVIFANGKRQDVRVRALIPAGGETRAIDLTGDNRGIDRIEMIYRAIPSFKGSAEVCVDGRQR